MSPSYILRSWSFAAAALFAMGTPALAQAESRVEIEYGWWSPFERFVVRYGHADRSYYAPPVPEHHEHHGHGGKHHRRHHHKHHRKHHDHYTHGRNDGDHRYGNLKQQVRDIYHNGPPYGNPHDRARRHRDHSDNPRSDHHRGDGNHPRFASDDHYRRH